MYTDEFRSETRRHFGTETCYQMYNNPKTVQQFSSVSSSCDRSVSHETGRQRQREREYYCSLPTLHVHYTLYAVYMQCTVLHTYTDPDCQVISVKVLSAHSLKRVEQVTWCISHLRDKLSLTNPDGCRGLFGDASDRHRSSCGRGGRS